ncbi:MAG: hypothetical protein ABL891_18335 [Burkholderiales bacterium]
MATEDPFVATAQMVAAKVLASPLYIDRGVPLLYQVTVDNALSITVDVKKPVRGRSSFETDLCVLERKSDQVSIPRVVLEFKTGITTHDILTYSAKAQRHKQIYPYLRYGIVASREASVPSRVFTHNQALDFFAAVKGLEGAELEAFFSDLLRAEVESSKRLESIAYEKQATRLFRSEILLKAL